MKDPEERAAAQTSKEPRSHGSMAQEHLQHNDYLSELGHELRAPLTSMRGLLEALCDDMIHDEDTKRRYYRILLGETIRLSGLINDIAAMHRLSGERPLELKEVNMSPMLDDMMFAFSAQANEYGMRIENRLTGDISALSDHDHVLQLFTILLDNAIVHSHKGENIIVSKQSSDEFKPVYKNIVSTREGETVLPPGKIVINIADSGCGIDPCDLPHVFERFYKADKKRGNAGTGLGLSIAKRIAAKLGETVIIQSEPNRGTTVSVTLTPYQPHEQ